MPMTQLDKQDLKWAVRRLPKDLQQLLISQSGRLFVAGGYIRSCITNEPVNDIDLFAPTGTEANSAVYVLSRKLQVSTHTTANAVTLRSKPAIQIIHRWAFDTPEEAIASFDFTIAKAAIWFDGEWKSLIADTFYADLAAKRLVYCAPERNEDAGGSLLRVLKFYQRGFRIPLDSLGAVLARMTKGEDLYEMGEAKAATVLTRLLREVDPEVDPLHVAHLPSEKEEEDEPQ